SGSSARTTGDTSIVAAKITRQERFFMLHLDQGCVVGKVFNVFTSVCDFCSAVWASLISSMTLPYFSYMYCWYSGMETMASVRLDERALCAPPCPSKLSSTSME